VLRYAVGARVEARFRGRERYYPATVRSGRANASGEATYDLIYDDGDTEREVAESLVREVSVEAAAAV
jgi:hypothetical protein